MKIARLIRDGKETYGLIKDDRVATKDDIIYQTGIPIPLNIKDFLFEGWYDEVKDKISDTCFKDQLEKFRLLARTESCFSQRACNIYETTNYTMWNRL